VLGTFTLLRAALDAWPHDGAARQRTFLHVSDREVYGSLGASDPAFREETPYRPNSALCREQGISDHLVRAYVTTYGMPALITNCRTITDPYQHPEKLIPLMIIHALEGKPLPVYGDGSNVRDWLHVSDHCERLMSVIERGRTGETYNVASGNERNNRDVVGLICDTTIAPSPAIPASPRAFRPVPPRRPLLSRADHLCDRPPRPLSPYAINRPSSRPSSAAVAASIRSGWTGPCAVSGQETMVARTSPAAPTSLDPTRITAFGSRSDLPAHPRA